MGAEETLDPEYTNSFLVKDVPFHVEDLRQWNMTYVKIRQRLYDLSKVVCTSDKTGNSCQEIRRNSGVSVRPRASCSGGIWLITATLHFASADLHGADRHALRLERGNLCNGSQSTGRGR